MNKRQAKKAVENMKEFIDKLIERLEELKELHAELIKDGLEEDYHSGCEGMCVDIIAIVNELAEEFGTDINVASKGWIPFKQRELTEEEKEFYGEEIEYMLDCKLPDDGEEIIVCYRSGYVDTDIFVQDEGCYLESGNEFVDDVIAWMPLPPAYTEGE